MPLITSDLEFSDDYPTIEPSLKLDFANARALDPRITFTRASTATYVGRDGLIKTAGEDEARFDHDPATGESLGLLIEESRLQRIPTSVKATDNSGNSSGTGWTLTANSGVSPDGTTTAVLLSQTQGLANSAILWWNGQMDTGRTFSFFVKHVSGSVNLHGQFGAGDLFTVNLSTGVTNASPTSRIRDIKIVNYSNGWKRISIYAVDIGSAASELVGGAVYLCMSSAASDVLLWGFQIEDGTFSTSYIPTAGASATRAQEEGNITGSAFSSFFNTTEGVLQTEFSKIGSVNNQMVVQFKDNNASERIEIRGQGSSGNSFRIEVIEGGATAAQEYTFHSNSPVANVVGQFAKVNLAYKQNDFASTINGTIASTDNSGDVGVCDRVGIGYANYGVRYNGHIKNIIYYPKRLTNTQLQTLTK